MNNIKNYVMVFFLFVAVEICASDFSNQKNDPLGYFMPQQICFFENNHNGSPVYEWVLNLGSDLNTCDLIIPTIVFRLDPKTADLRFLDPRLTLLKFYNEVWENADAPRHHDAIRYRSAEEFTRNFLLKIKTVMTLDGTLSECALPASYGRYCENLAQSGLLPEEWVMPPVVNFNPQIHPQLLPNYQATAAHQPVPASNNGASGQQGSGTNVKAKPFMPKTN